VDGCFRKEKVRYFIEGVTQGCQVIAILRAAKKPETKGRNNFCV